jgi:predicted transcriptional regulator
MVFANNKTKIHAIKGTQVWGGESSLVVNNRRCEMEIISEILSLCKEGAKKTQILYRTNLSYTQLQDYLSFLLKTGVLKAHNTAPYITYTTTEKGLNVLDNITKLFNELKVE